MEPKAAPFSHQSVRFEDNGINVCSAPPRLPILRNFRSKWRALSRQVCTSERIRARCACAKARIHHHRISMRSLSRATPVGLLYRRIHFATSRTAVDLALSPCAPARFTSCSDRTILIAAIRRAIIRERRFMIESARCIVLLLRSFVPRAAPARCVAGYCCFSIAYVRYHVISRDICQIVAQRRHASSISRLRVRRVVRARDNLSLHVRTNKFAT